MSREQTMNAPIDDFAINYAMFRPQTFSSVKVPGQRRRIPETSFTNPNSLVFPPPQNLQREVTYETACCNGPSTFIMTGKKMADDQSVLSPEMLIATAKVPKRVTTRIMFE